MSAQDRSRAWADLAAAGGAAALAVVLWVGAREINLGVGYDRIGPRFFPYAVALGLMVIAAVLAIRGLLGLGARSPAIQRDEAESDRMDWGPFAWVVIALLLDLVLLQRAGFVLASAAQFWVVARAFRSKRPVRDAVVAVLVAVIVYYAFSRGLGLSLPAGIFEKLSIQ
ncbi:MAG TPA: tripartite tricarboxylate transporter TctB family protein [Myxococcaceae bacterium]|jgi:putative tricarboxylic transport membrane protein|nr:tripartite tricarboxylate transporter TctB family protein [Myxococcaceae bacterium]